MKCTFWVLYACIQQEQADEIQFDYVQRYNYEYN